MRRLRRRPRRASASSSSPRKRKDRATRAASWGRGTRHRECHPISVKVAAEFRAGERARTGEVGGSERRYSVPCRPGGRGPATARGKSGHRRAGRWGNPRGRKPTESGTERRPPPALSRCRGKGEKVGYEPTSVVVTRRLAKPRPVQREAGSDDAARRGTGYAARAAGQPAAQRDGHSRQNPAYRPANEKPRSVGAFPCAGKRNLP